MDLPDNKNPMYLPPRSGSENGHSFVVITKSNGASAATDGSNQEESRHKEVFCQHYNRYTIAFDELCGTDRIYQRGL